MATTGFTIGRDLNGYLAYSLSFTNLKYSMVLAANVAQSITIPSEAGIAKYRVIIVPEPGATVWASDSAAATIPTGAVALTSSELNPGPRDVNPGVTISLITPDTTAQVGVQIYAL